MMKRLFNTNFSQNGMHIMLLILRVGIGLMMLTHGYPKLLWATAGGEVQFGDPIGVGAATSLYLAVFAEFVCSVLLILGLATRLALIPLLITMVVAVVVVHGADAFDKKELATHFMLVYLFLLASGPGRYSIDHLISRNMRRRRR